MEAINRSWVADKGKEEATEQVLSKKYLINIQALLFAIKQS
jgi:hypothetical protein